MRGTYNQQARRSGGYHKFHITTPVKTLAPDKPGYILNGYHFVLKDGETDWKYGVYRSELLNLDIGLPALLALGAKPYEIHD